MRQTKSYCLRKQNLFARPTSECGVSDSARSRRIDSIAEPGGQMARISVIGLGYVGLVTAAGLAELGHQVIGVDIDDDKVARLGRGELPLYEPGLDNLVARNRAAGRLRFTGDYSRAVPPAEFVFVAVNT